MNSLYPNPSNQNLMANPLAPAYMQGVEGDLGGMMRLDPQIQPFNVVLTASQANVQSELLIDSGANVMLMGISVPTATGLFSFQLSDGRLYFLSPGPLLSTVFSTDPLNPTPIIGNYDTGLQTGGLWFAAGSRINIILNELSGAENTIQILFHQAKIIRL